MKVIVYPKTLSGKKKIMILGAFASFHNGHKILYDVAKSLGKNISLLLIDNVDFLPNKGKKIYMDLDIRLQSLANMGIQEVIILKMNLSILNKDGKEFASELQEKYNVEKFVIGQDFSMGKGAKYLAKDLANDFPTTVVKTEKVNNQKISTTLLKEMVMLGDVEIIKKNSPFPYTIKTRVSNERFFSINDRNILPHAGIYACWAIINDLRYWSTILIKKDNNNYIYIPELNIKNSGFDVILEFHKKIRSVVKDSQSNIEDDDKEATINYFKNNT